jgi:hypothetical protein
LSQGARLAPFKFTCFVRETAGTCPQIPELGRLWSNVHGAWVWTLSRNFTGMPVSAGEWHAWPAAPKVETRGKAWQRDGCAALRNLKRPRVRQRRLPLAAGTHPRQSVRGNDGKSWGIDSEKQFRVTLVSPSRPRGFFLRLCPRGVVMRGLHKSGSHPSTIGFMEHRALRML